MTRVLVVDNYDSFVHNIVGYLCELGADVVVRRNDEPGLVADAAGFDGVLLSPGPGRPEDAGFCVDLVRDRAGSAPVFGVCLGLQAIGAAFGATIERAAELLHGKVSKVRHDGRGVFVGVPQDFVATRYHSLALLETSIPPEIEVSARTESGVVMAIRHKSLPVEAVQFHPESILTEHGHLLLANWLVACGDPDAPARASTVSPLLR